MLIYIHIALHYDSSACEVQNSVLACHGVFNQDPLGGGGEEVSTFGREGHQNVFYNTTIGLCQ